MKKLMIAVASVVFAAGVQAATVSWNTTNVYGNDGEKATAGSAYFLTASSQTAANELITAINGTAGKGKAAFLAALEGGFSYDMPTTYESSTGTKNVPAGTYSYTKAIFGADNLPTNTQLGLSDGGNYYGFLVVVSDSIASTTDNSMFYISNTMDFTAGTGADDAITIAIGSQQTASQADGAWKQVGVAVPEPTSALLLILGVAGLALKRKHA